MAVVGPVIARMRAKAPRETAWQYIAHPELRAEWWPDVELDVVFGGAVAERWTAENGEAASRNAVGTVDVLIEGHALGFRWRDGDDPHETAVLITFRSQGDETDIMVTETGFGVFPDAFERTADAQQSWIDLLTDYVAALREVAPVEAEVVEVVAVSEAEAEVVETADEAEAAETADEAEVAEVLEAAEAAEAEVVESAEVTETEAEAESEAAEIDQADDEAEAAENDQADDEAEVAEAESTDDVESSELSDLEELFEADEAPDTETPEPSNVDAQQADEDPEDEAPDFDSLIRGDVGDKA